MKYNRSSKIMTISTTKKFLDLIEKICQETKLKKSTIIRFAVEEWARKNIME